MEYSGLGRPALVDEARQRGVIQSGTKAELIERLHQNDLDPYAGLTIGKLRELVKNRYLPCKGDSEKLRECLREHDRLLARVQEEDHDDREDREETEDEDRTDDLEDEDFEEAFWEPSPIIIRASRPKSPEESEEEDRTDEAEAEELDDQDNSDEDFDDLEYIRNLYRSQGHDPTGLSIQEILNRMSQPQQPPASSSQLSASKTIQIVDYQYDTSLACDQAKDRRKDLQNILEKMDQPHPNELEWLEHHEQVTDLEQQINDLTQDISLKKSQIDQLSVRMRRLQAFGQADPRQTHQFHQLNDDLEQLQSQLDRTQSQLSDLVDNYQTRHYGYTRQEILDQIDQETETIDRLTQQIESGYLPPELRN